MACHAQSLTCHLLACFVRIDREECESVEIILGLIPMFNCNNGINFVAPRTRNACRRLLPQLTGLAARHNPVYNVQKPYHMINLPTMLATIIGPLVSHQSSYERSELHSTISAAQSFLHSDLTNIRTVVSKWIRANPNGLATSSRHHIGAWEYSIKPITRPTARIVIPPSEPPARIYIRTHRLRPSATFSRRRTAQTMSTCSQESKIADILEALELVEPSAGRARSDSGSSSSDSSCVSTPGKDDLDSRFDYAALDRKHSIL